MPARPALGLALAVLLAGTAIAAEPATLVRVDGGRIQGAVVDGVRVFKDIPFAAPPIGALRWVAPQPVVAWSGVRDATAFGPQCPQTPYPTSIYRMAPAPMSEDCLQLNVWTTAAAGARRPVMVWIHGGAWTRGATSAARHADAPTYDGAALARQGVVLVTVNYRLGALGFLAHPALSAESTHHASGNYAFLDHLAALAWVKRNVATFGGDPGNVTVFGESAGSWSVNVLDASPLAAGLFRRAIGESGAMLGRAGATESLATAEAAGVAFARALGADSLAALRALPAERLVADDGFEPKAVVDGWVLPQTPDALFATGHFNRVPVLVGSNADEMTTLTRPDAFPTTLEAFHALIEARFPGAADGYAAAYPVADVAGIPAALLASGRDAFFALGMRSWARAVTRAGQHAYLYEFAHAPPGPYASRLGAYHAAELRYVFANLPAGPPYADVDRALSRAMSAYWVNFATHGDPNGPGLPSWAPYDATDEHYLEFGDAPVARQHLRAPQLDFLERAAIAREAARP